MEQGENEPNDAFKICFDKVCNIMELAGGETPYKVRISPRMESKPQRDKNKHKLTIWRQCVSFLMKSKEVQFPFQAAEERGQRRQV